MGEITIIEDCAPYFVRFTHTGIDSVIRASMDAILPVKFWMSFTHHKLSIEDGLKITEQVPFFDHFDLTRSRVSMFVSQAGYYKEAHKDGFDIRFGFNYTVKVLDDKCVTSWYSDELDDIYNIGATGKVRTRECLGFIKENHKPLKSFVAQANECILFNTDIYHDFDNRSSNNERIILTLRSLSNKTMTFADARIKLLALAEK